MCDWWLMGYFGQRNWFMMSASSFDLVLTFKLNMALGGYLENCIFNTLVPNAVWLMLCGVFGGKEIIFNVSLNQAFAVCYHIGLVVNPCSDNQIKMVVCGYLRKISLNCFISHAAPCHMSWWVHFTVCCFGPLNHLLHVYLYYTACFPLVICIIWLLPVHMVCHHLYCTTALSIQCLNCRRWKWWCWGSRRHNEIMFGSWGRWWYRKLTRVCKYRQDATQADVYIIFNNSKFVIT